MKQIPTKMFRVKWFFTFGILMLGISLQGQDYIDLIVRDICACMGEQPEKKEDIEALIKCTLVASLPYEDRIRKEKGIDLEEYDGLVDFLPVVGEKMMQTCPKVTHSIFLELGNAGEQAPQNSGPMICNTTDESVLLAIGIDAAPFVSAGWYVLEPGKCQKWDTDMPEEQLYYYACAPEAGIAWRSDSDEVFNLDFRGSFTIKGDEGCFGCKSARFLKYNPTVQQGQKAVFLSKSQASEWIAYKTASKSKFQFCNETGEDILISLGIDLAEKFSMGWFVVNPGECYETDFLLPEEFLHYYAFNASGYEWKADGGVKFKTNTKDIFSAKESEYCADCKIIGYRSFDFEKRQKEAEFQTIRFYLADARRIQSEINPWVAMFALVAGAAILLDGGDGGSDYSSPSASEQNRKWLERQKQIDYDIRRAEQREAERGGW